MKIGDWPDLRGKERSEFLSGNLDKTTLILYNTSFFISYLYIVPYTSGRKLMTDNSGSVEAAMVFEKLFSDYLDKQDSDAMRMLLIKKLDKLKQDEPNLGGLEVRDDGRISINIRNINESKMVLMLSIAFDSLIDVVAFSKGHEDAFKEAENVVTRVMKQFKEPFDRLNIKNHILKGAMTGTISSGMDGMDEVLGNGFPCSDMILLIGPAGTAKYHFAYQFLSDGLNKGGAGLAVLSSMSVKEMRERLSKLKVNVTSCESKNRLRTVDWYTQKSRPVAGMEEQGSVLVPSKDIANLDIAFMRGVEGLSFAPTKRAMVDIITQALNTYDLPDVIEFVQRQKARLKNADLTSLFIVEEGAHDDRILSTLKHMADGVLIISSDKDGKLFIEVESLSAPRFERGKFALQITNKGMSVVGDTPDELSVISEFCNIPKVTKEIAQRLVDAGFTDIEKLNSAEESELRRVNSVTEDIAKSIREYTRTVEYSQSVLSNRSEKWIKRAKEQAATGDLKRAKKSLERAIEIDSSNPFAWMELSRISKLLGESEDSEEHYKKAVSIDPSIEGGD